MAYRITDLELRRALVLKMELEMLAKLLRYPLKRIPIFCKAFLPLFDLFLCLIQVVNFLLHLILYKLNAITLAMIEVLKLVLLPSFTFFYNY